MWINYERNLQISGSEISAVHAQHLPGEKTGLRRGQKKEGPGHVLGGPQAAQGGLLREGLEVLRREAGVHFCVDNSRSHAVYRDAGGPKLPGQGLSEADDPRFGGGIGRLAGGPRAAHMEETVRMRPCFRETIWR